MTRGRLAVVIVVPLLIVVGVISGVVIAKGDAWKEFAIDSINENISTLLEVGDVDISVWSSFPQISVDLHNVKIEAAKNRSSDQPSSLIEVDRLGVAFSLWDLLFGNPVIRSVALESGEINLVGFLNGKWNYDITATSEDAKNIEITTISLINVDFSLIQKGGVHSRVFVSEATLKDGFVDVSFDDLFYDDLQETLSPIYGDFSAEFTIDSIGVVKAQINNGTLNSFNFNCNINYTDDDSWSLVGGFAGLTSASLEDLLINTEALNGWSYGGRGAVSFTVNENGTKINFSLPESEFAVAPEVTGLALNNTGRLSAIGSVELDLSSSKFALELEKVKIISNGLILEFSGDSKNVGKEALNLKGKAYLDLGASYKSWLPEIQGSAWSSLPDEGSIELRGEITILASGVVRSPLLVIESPRILGSLNSIPYSLYNVRAELSEGDLLIEGLDFDWAGNVGSVTSKIKDFDRVIDGGPIRGDLNISAESLLIDPVLSWWDNMPDSPSERETTLLSFGSNLNCSIISTTLLWDALECEEVSVRGLISASRIQISFASTKGLGGEATVQGSLRPGGPGWLLGLSGTVSNISLIELFRVYNNFDQEAVRTEHLEGRADVAGSMHLGWNKGGDWQSNAFDADLEVSISNGRLLKLEMFDAVADYLKDHRLMAPLVDPEDMRSRLSDIEFDYVESPITIATSTVSVPFLKIQSSAMDVSIEGAQTFAGEIDYTLGFALRDLKDDKQGGFGNIQDDGLGTMFFLGMEGSLSDPEYSYDRVAHRAHRRRALSAEAERIRNALSGKKDGEKEVEEAPKVKTRKPKSDILDDPEDDDF